jgi:hypothetical protein
MSSLQFTAESSSNGMVERDFTVGEIPGVLWSPASSAADRAPLVLMGHGGGNHKKHPAMAGRARAAGEPEGPIVVRYNDHLAELAVPEWRTTLDALQELPEIGADGPVGYFGINMGTAIGVPLVAIEPRITAAVFGQHWPDVLAEKAKQITIPIEFDMQWDDEHIPREAGLALFDAFASKEKTLHANAGKHKELPRFEADSAVLFFARHFGRAVTSPA